MRRKKLYLNTISSLISQLITIVCGFVLPRYMLSYYGTNINGLVSSITQFLGFISLLQLGVGAVIQSALYKPLAENNEKKISEIYVSASKFFKKLAYIFLLYILILCVFFPIKFANTYDTVYVIALILSISISLFVQYYFGLSNQILLYADQKAYIYLFLQSFLLIINTILCVFLIKTSCSIQIVKLVSSITFAINPIFLSIYVRKKYKVNTRIRLDYEPIEQKWNGFIQHFTSVVMDNTDVIVLTIFSSLSNVSIYYVYHLVVFGIRQIVTAITVGIQSLFGEMIAKHEVNELKSFFSKIEIIFHYFITILYACVLNLIVPFVKVYTKGVDDANYNVPIFAFVISLGFALYCYRVIYYTLIKAAGHFKETQLSACIEIILNLVISITFVIKYGLIGVAIGTLIANLYRLLYLVVYLKKNIIQKSLLSFLKLISLDIIIFLLCYFFSGYINFNDLNFLSWFIYAFKIGVICLCTTTVLYSIFNYKIIKKFIVNNMN